MQIELVAKPSAPQSNGGFVAQKQSVKNRHLLRQLNIQRGWKVLLLTVVNEEDVSFLARCVSHQGELIVLDSDMSALNRIEWQKKNGAFKSAKLTGDMMHTAFYPPKRVDLPIATAEFDGETIPYPDDYFDAVLCSRWGVETAVSPEMIKQALYRVVRPGGLVFCPA